MKGCLGFSIDIYGKGGHGSIPHICRDPGLVMNRLYFHLLDLPARYLEPKHAVVMSIPAVYTSSKANNMYGDSATILGTVR